MFFIAIVITISSFAQDSFMDVPVGGTKMEAVNKFKAKGFSVVKLEDTYVRMQGKMGNTNIELAIVTSPITFSVWKYSVYLPKRDTWYELKSEFESYKSTLVSKYGEPTSDYHFFSNPYDEGDGYELSAITLGKCSFSSFWGEKMSLQISKYKQVNISYENPVNSKLDDEEKEKLKLKNF